jgi:Na+/proline symporter
MGVLLGSAVVPIALCITWSKANKWGCIGGAVAGLVAGIVAWMVTTAKLNPIINVQTSGGDYEMLAGNLAAIGVGGIVSVVVSYLVSSCCAFSRYSYPTSSNLCRNPRTSTSTLPAPLMTISTTTTSRSRLMPLPKRTTNASQLRRTP